MVTRIVVLTASELRHRFFRKSLALSPDIEVVRSFCETHEGSLGTLIETSSASDSADLRAAHIRQRDQSEEDFFLAFDVLSPDHSNPVSIRRGQLNEDVALQAEACRIDPDLLVCYGTSIIRGSMLSDFDGRFLNIHLGLSPYYRGSGTNFWPLANRAPEYLGVTFMHIDSGVDTGEVIHQIRPLIHPTDDPHQIGNRLIRDMSFVCADLIRRFKAISRAPQIEPPENAKVYRKKDFTEYAVSAMRRNFQEGMIEDFLAEYDSRISRVPIVKNAAMEA